MGYFIKKRKKEKERDAGKGKGRGCLFSTHKHSLNDLSNTATSGS